MPGAPDPLYVAARQVLLDALESGATIGASTAVLTQDLISRLRRS